MGRTLIFDKIANEKLKQLLDKSESDSGLLIGCIEESKDFILYVIPTPVNNDNQNSSETNQTKKLYDESWIVNHALQIHDLLIGGLDILGLYTIDMQASNARQLLTKIFKSLNEFPYYKQMNFNSERVLFQVDRSSKNVNMKTIDVSNSKSNAQKCEMNVQDNLLNEFYTINSNYDINSIFTMPNVYNHDLLKRSFYSALSTEFMFDKNRFLCLINNCFFQDDKKFFDLLPILNKSSLPSVNNNNDNNNISDSNNNFSNTSIENNSSLNESKLDDSGTVLNDDDNDSDNDDQQHKKYFATLLENLSQSTSLINQNNEINDKKDDFNELPQNLDSLYHVTGVCSSIIFFHKYTTIRSIRQKLIYDIMRSLFARLRLLTDDLDARKEIIGDVQLEDPNSVEESYQTPNRIYINIDEKNKKKLFLISDYVFPDETSADIVDRIKELFNYEIKDPNKQIIHVEKFPPEIQVSQLDDNCSTINTDSNKNIIENANNSLINNNTMYFLFALFIAILAIILSYWLFK